MIIDSIKNCNLYYSLGENYIKAFEFIKNTNLNNIQCGKYNIDGDNIFANVMEYNTKDYSNCLWEAHKQYIDIQFVIKGIERMGYTNINNIDINVEYNSERDILFGEGNGSLLDVPEGYFTIFMPSDAHMPSLNADKTNYVKKVVIKIKA